MVAYGEFGRETEMLVQDSSCLAGEGEAVSFLTLQARAMAALIYILLIYFKGSGHIYVHLSIHLYSSLYAFIFIIV